MSDKFDVFSTSFANNIFRQKYSMNGQETWADTCERVVEASTDLYERALKRGIAKESARNAATFKHPN